MAGLTTQGLTVKTYQETLEDLNARAVAEFGPDVNTGSKSVLGHILVIVALALSEVWSLLRILYDAFNPHNATGVHLDNLSALVGVTREAATKASGTVTLTGTAGVQVDAGKMIRVEGTEDDFLLTETVIIGGGGTVDVVVEAEEAGDLSVPPGATWDILTPVSGWSSVSNALAFSSGLDAESDAALRIRRLESLQIVSAATDGSLRAKVTASDGVSAALVQSNRTMAVDAWGIPPKAFRVVVWPDSLSADQQEEVARVIWENMPAGIEPDGTEDFLVTDDQGYSQTVKFSFASTVNVTVDIEYTKDAEFPADGEDLIEAAVQVYLDTLSVADDVLWGKVVAAIYEVPGVVDAPTVEINGAAVNLGIDLDEVAVTAAINVSEAP